MELLEQNAFDIDESLSILHGTRVRTPELGRGLFEGWRERRAEMRDIARWCRQRAHHSMLKPAEVDRIAQRRLLRAGR